MKSVLALLYIVLTTTITGLITQDGLWTGNDYSDPDGTQIRVRNGIPSGTETFRKKIINDAYMWEPADLDAVYLQSNIQRIGTIMGYEDFDFLFPYKDSSWTYEKFLTAAAHYPRFCGRRSRIEEDTFLDACKRELAVLLAHIATDTNAFDESDVQPFWR